jgi:DNA replication protein DnaD
MSETIDQLQDLANKSSRSTIAVIDAMTQRGAFKGEELSTIGTLRDQCIQVVQICEQLQQEAAMEDEEEE